MGKKYLRIKKFWWVKKILRMVIRETTRQCEQYLTQPAWNLSLLILNVYLRSKGKFFAPPLYDWSIRWED